MFPGKLEWIIVLELCMMNSNFKHDKHLRIYLMF